MSSIKLSPNASGTGEFTIAAPNSNTNRTLTLPDNTGTIVTTGSTAGVSQTMLASGLAGTGPAFSAYLSSDQSVSSGVLTKILLNTENFDTNNCYDNTTNYRFTPTTAGYYGVSMAALLPSSTTAAVIALYKNGSKFTETIFVQSTGVSTQYPLTTLVYLNGSTDYLEFYAQTNGGTSIRSGSTGTFASAFLARAA